MERAPFSYFNIVSSNPPMISLAIKRTEKSTQKDTSRNITFLKEFVVHIVDEQNVEKINETAARLSPNESEIEYAGLTPIDSVKVSVPGVKEAKVRMECVLEEYLELGGTNSPDCDFFIGRVVQYHIEDDIYENGRIDTRGLGAISRIAGAGYATIGEIFELERPN